MTFFDDYRSATQTVTIKGSPFEKLLAGLEQPVEELYICTKNYENLLAGKRVAVVGTRKVTPYGRYVTEQFAGELAGQGITIVSGLAYGVDSIAHQAALDAGGITIAVLPSSLSRIYPEAHTGLARKIIEQGGALISEYPIGSDIAYKNQFVDRNRIVSGISDALLITEAAKDSGTMHTASFALDQGKTVLVVPGDITSPYSEGTNNLLLEPRAGAATRPIDVLRALDLSSPEGRPPVKGKSAAEQTIINLLVDKIRDGEQLLATSRLTISEFNHALTMLEITGRVYALGNNQWTLR